MRGADEREILALETQLADVMSLSDLRDRILGPLESILGASGTWLFAFGPSSEPVILGGSLAEAMRDYSVEILAADPLQSYARSLPAGALYSNERNDFDAEAYLRSAAYAEFYRPQSIEFVQGVYPTNLAYGAPHMFGIALSMRTLEAYMRSMVPVLQHLEAPLRAAARRIMRFRSLEAERDVLELISADRGLCALWDEAANLVWLSPNAVKDLDGRSLDTLERAVTRAVRQSSGRETSLSACILGRPFTLRGLDGLEWEAELSRVCTPEHRVYMLARLRARRGAGCDAAGLTQSETRVLQLIVRGSSNREAARELFVSEQTVKAHVSHILAKLGVSSRAKAAVIARARGLVDEASEPSPSMLDEDPGLTGGAQTEGRSVAAAGSRPSQPGGIARRC